MPRRPGPNRVLRAADDHPRQHREPRTARGTVRGAGPGPASDGDGLSHRRIGPGDCAQRDPDVSLPLRRRTVFIAQMSSGIAANPYLRFFVTARASGELVFDWVDDAGTRESERVPVTVDLMPRHLRARALDRRTGARMIAIASVLFAGAATAPPAAAQTRPIPQLELRSGIAFAGPDVQAMQARRHGQSRRFCGSSAASACGGPRPTPEHRAARRAMATRRNRCAAWRPAIRRTTLRRGRCSTSRRASSDCRTRHQQAAPLPAESEDLPGARRVRRVAVARACPWR